MVFEWASNFADPRVGTYTPPSKTLLQFLYFALIWPPLEPILSGPPVSRGHENGLIDSPSIHSRDWNLTRPGGFLSMRRTSGVPSNPRHRQSAFFLTGILGSFLWVMVWTLPVAAHSIEVGVGFHTNFDSDHRNVYGAATALSLGYSAPLTPKDVRLMVEVAYLSASGNEFPPDPFFQRSDASYWVLPLIVGLRTNFVPSRDRQTVAFYGGIGFASMLSGFKDPNGTT